MGKRVYIQENIFDHDHFLTRKINDTTVDVHLVFAICTSVDLRAEVSFYFYSFRESWASLPDEQKIHELGYWIYGAEGDWVTHLSIKDLENLIDLCRQNLDFVKTTIKDKIINEASDDDVKDDLEVKYWLSEYLRVIEDYRLKRVNTIKDRLKKHGLDN